MSDADRFTVSALTKAVESVLGQTIDTQYSSQISHKVATLVGVGGVFSRKRALTGVLVDAESNSIQICISSI